MRSRIVRTLIDFMNERKMQVKMNNKTFSSYDLIGGSPQGSLIGQLLYLIGSDDAAEKKPDEDKLRYVDADFLKAFFLRDQYFCLKILRKQNGPKTYKFYEKLPKKGKPVVKCAFLRSQTQILRDL